MNFNMKRLVISSTLALVICLSWGNTFWIYGKAKLAHYLIADAWHSTLSDRKNHKPWRWADTWPIAELRYPKMSLQFYILNGSDGSALAFGPGHLSESALPHENGTIILSGHRDTHFSFLEKIDYGDVIEIKNRLGKIKKYRITHIDIIDITDRNLGFHLEKEELQLITCYPFNSIVPGGPLRLVVTAKKIAENKKQTQYPIITFKN